MRNSERCRKLVRKVRRSMSEGAMSNFEWWWWFDHSDVRWRACVVTMRRLNRYEVIEIRRLSGIENLQAREIILYSVRSETFSQWRYFRIRVICWNLERHFEQEHSWCVPTIYLIFCKTIVRRVAVVKLGVYDEGDNCFGGVKVRDRYSENHECDIMI